MGQNDGLLKKSFYRCGQTLTIATLAGKMKYEKNDCKILIAGLKGFDEKRWV